MVAETTEQRVDAADAAPNGTDEWAGRSRRAGPELHGAGPTRSTTSCGMRGGSSPSASCVKTKT